MDDCGASLSDLDDDINLRCFDQKRRFGIDFLQPLDRYVTALTSTQVQDRDGNIVRNPLFTDLDPSDGVDEVRDPSLVVLAAIVGVPWQDIARIDAAGNPDLTVGIQSASQMTANKTWDLLLGDSAKPPLDPLMIESVKPRSGVQPVTGQAVAPPGAAYDGNSINGHEYDIPDKDDLQYACVFELPTARDCSMVSTPGCECFDPGNKPLCQDPVNDGYGSTQYRAKAYPGVRYLRAAQTLGAQAVVGSICPAQLDSPTDADYGFTAAMTAVVAATDGKRR
jgi:hypothetical protein